MELFVVVVVAALAAGVVSTVVALEGPGEGLLDSRPEERWVVRHVLRRGDVTRWRGAGGEGGRRRTGVALVVVGFALALTVAAVLGALVRIAAGSGPLASWDRALSEWGSTRADDRAVDLLRSVTQLGGTPVVAVSALAYAVVDRLRHRRGDVALFLWTVVAGQLLLANAIKVLVDRPRPDVLQLVGTHGPSFPSGHTTSAAAAWAALALVATRRSSRRVRSIGAGLAALVAVAVAASRALLGVHWATDVLGGLALGWAWFLFVAVAFGGRLQRLGAPAERAERPGPTGPTGPSGPTRPT